MATSLQCVLCLGYGIGNDKDHETVLFLACMMGVACMLGVCWCVGYAGVKSRE